MGPPLYQAGAIGRTRGDVTPLFLEKVLTLLLRMRGRFFLPFFPFGGSREFFPISPGPLRPHDEVYPCDQLPVFFSSSYRRHRRFLPSFFAEIKGLLLFFDHWIDRPLGDALRLPAGIPEPDFKSGSGLFFPFFWNGSI